MNDNHKATPAAIELALRYLKAGALGEVVGLADIAFRSGQPKIQMDTDMAVALGILASQAGGLGDPVAWRVKDYADGWMLCHTEAQARALADNGNTVQALYLFPNTPTKPPVG